ncbi:MAG TPA: Holliday junction resolvase RuvX [Phycisphaerales bacterium]|nr:Holliday junction resolvase RuvX [Phycisphaerales bacterium]
MRYLCIDLGDKRTGLAISDSVTRIVSPLDVLEVPITDRNGDALLDALLAAIFTNFSPASPLEIIFGLPLNMTDASEGPRAKLVRNFAARLGPRLQPARDIRFHDERLSSVQADWTMAQSGMTHKQKKTRRDALAAAAILTDYLSTIA